MDLYQSEKGKMMSIFEKHANRVSVTTDTWTSIQNINYMVVTAHFMDDDRRSGSYTKGLLTFVQLPVTKGKI